MFPETKSVQIVYANAEHLPVIITYYEISLNVLLSLQFCQDDVANMPLDKVEYAAGLGVNVIVAQILIQLLTSGRLNSVIDMLLVDIPSNIMIDSTHYCAIAKRYEDAYLSVMQFICIPTNTATYNLKLW